MHSRGRNDTTKFLIAERKEPRSTAISPSGTSPSIPCTQGVEFRDTVPGLGQIQALGLGEWLRLALLSFVSSALWMDQCPERTVASEATSRDRGGVKYGPDLMLGSIGSPHVVSGCGFSDR